MSKYLDRAMMIASHFFSTTEDTSYKNDLTESFSITTKRNEVIQFMVPNSEVQDEDQEQFNTYQVSWINDCQVLLQLDTEDHLINFLKATQ